MASSSPRQLALLFGLLAVLAGILYYNRPGSGPTTSGSSAAERAVPPPDATGVEPIRLDRLEARGPEPDGAPRDLFRFGQPALVASRPSSVDAGVAVPVSAAPPASESGPPAAPVIALKFIGVVEPASSGTLAVLSDGRNVFYGREGDTIEGRYRIDRIGVESIEMSHLDGRGRQVIRLSGS